ncbi:ammonium transporter [Sphaerochaeta globosa]|uniref:Ammonium transporter n=1 Tax=Sphaerochaeta globosa (strain ATCC BAA-1886 / DSM 22777 / Buddy) TaxID=158189 RepID=F0RVD2_SPHGB|nr:ammonium transporter [Sphaerochaeta globosa]ADY12924.1 ammonium transporter [Sphaerochaeta globosa str. Buddy]
MYTSVDTLWVLLGTALVFFMQAGFAMVETGFTRAKNAGNIIMKNLMDFCLGSVAFWVVGFGLMFGLGKDGQTHPLFGMLDFFILREYGSAIPSYAFIMFQTVFCATAATIVSGAMAERTKFVSYCVYSLIISALIYPVSGHWIWGGGWLAQLGFHDFAGSTAVHMVGGVAAFWGAKRIGARIGKYDSEKRAQAIPGHSLTLGALGVFILWFCWFGFNGGSTLGMSSDASQVSASAIFFNTNLAAAMAACATMLLTWWRYKKPDVSMTLNGALAGLVGITAGCDAVSPLGAAAIGLISGVVVVFAVEFFEKVAHIDDPVGAISVHGICGALGTLLVGLFAVDGGLFYGGGFTLLGIQALGVGSVVLWVSVTMVCLFILLEKTVGLRVSHSEEIAGLDLKEHGLCSSYADFMPAVPSVLGSGVPEDVAIPVVEVPPMQKSSREAPLTKVVIVSRQSKFNELKEALNGIGVMGMTVTQVMGCGMQKGQKEYYRGVAVSPTLLPKMQLETVVSKVPVRSVIEAAKKALYTGHIGDGKIFVYTVDNVIKVRTGEEGYDALQDEILPD